MCRPGETPHGVVTDTEDYVSRVPSRTSGTANANSREVYHTYDQPQSTQHHHMQHRSSDGAGSFSSLTDMSISSQSVVGTMSPYGRQSKSWQRAFKLGVSGEKFSDALFGFLAQEGTHFMSQRASVADSRPTGTSRFGDRLYNRAMLVL